MTILHGQSSLVSLTEEKLLHPSNDVFKITCYFHQLLKRYTNCMSTFKSKTCINDALHHFSGSVFLNHRVGGNRWRHTHELKLIKIIGFMFFKIKCYDLAKIYTILQNTATMHRATTKIKQGCNIQPHIKMLWQYFTWFYIVFICYNCL